MSPAELLAKVQALVKEQEEYMQTLIMETLGFRWGTAVLVPDTPTVITLSQPYAEGANDYTIWRQVKLLEGTHTEVEILAQNNLSFTVRAPLSCSFEFITLRPSINIIP